MRLHQLVPQVTDVVVTEAETGRTVVLTPMGAVFDNEFTDDLLNMSVCFGMLIVSDKWRYATQEEIDALREEEGGKVLQLEWAPPKKGKSKLKVVGGTDRSKK